MLITVLMSVYNSEKYLKESIDSILNQTFKEFEFIIVDDGSTDGSIEIIQQYLQIDSRIVFIKNETNIGLPSSLNKGIKLAKGKYIARQDADDISSLDRLEIQINYALENKQIDIIASNCYVIDISGNTVYEDTSYSETNNFYEKVLNLKGLFPHGSALLKKSKLLEVGLYDPRFYYTQDGEYWLRLISSGAKLHILHEPLYFYRTAPVAFTKRSHAKRMFNDILNLTYTENKNEELINSELEKVNKYLAAAPLEPRPYYIADYWKSLGNAAYLNGSTKSLSYKYILRAFREKNSPGNYLKYLVLSLVYVLPAGLVKQLVGRS